MKLSFTFAVLEWRYGYEKSMQMIKDAGFEAFDYSLDGLVKDNNVFNTDKWEEQAKAIRAYADKLGLEINQTHSPFTFSTSQILNNPEKFESVFFERTVKAIKISGIFGAKVCVIHPLHHFVFEGHEDEIFEKNMVFYKRLLPYAKEAGVKIGVENMYQRDSRRNYFIEDTCATISDFTRYIDTMNDESIVACLDIGHVGICQRVSEPWDLARALGHNRLQALHVHDNDYIGDNHQVPYVGKIDWKKVCQALGEIDYQGDFTYECGWAFVANIDDEFMPVALKYMSDIGHHLCDLVDRARPQNQ